MTFLVVIMEWNMPDLPKIGIDIGSSSIKLVELVPAGKQWRLVSAASAPVGTAIAAILKEAGMKSRRAVVALPEEQVSTHIVELPMMKEGEIEQALEWQVEQYIPIPKDEAVWSWEIVRRDETGGGVEILLVAAAKTLVESYRKTVETAGLELVAVETELNATARADVKPGSPLSVVVDIGAKSTDMGIVREGQLIFAQTIPTAGDAFTRAIETGLGLDHAQAEQYKNTYGMNDKELEGKLAEAMKPVLAVVAGEIRKTIDFYVTKHQGEAVKMVVLSGGAAGMPEIVGKLSAILGLEVVMGDPFVGLIMDEAQKKAFANSGPYYAVAIGLAEKPI